MKESIAASPWYLARIIKNPYETEAYNSQTDNEVLDRIVIVKGQDNKFIVFTQIHDLEGEVTNHDLFTTDTLQEASKVWLNEVNKTTSIAANTQNSFYASQASIRRYGF